MASEPEVVVVGGGAAGIAAAARLRDAGVSALIVEARPRLGGRAFTDETAAGGPIDLGCGWLHSADQNPWREIAEAQGCTIDQTPPWARPSGPAGPMPRQAAFLDALRSFRRRLEEAGDSGADRPAAAFLDPGGQWNGLLDAVSTYFSGTELANVSVRDFARYEDTGVNWRVVEGYGRAIAAHGAGLPAKLDCPVTRIDHSGRQVQVETAAGVLTADAAIVTLPSNLIAANEDLFRPLLPEKTAAAAGLPLGLADKLFLSLSEGEEFEPESRVFGRTDRTATAAYHFRPFGRSQIEAYFGGAWAAELEAGGEGAFFDFAVAELTAIFGGAFARRIKPLALHRWGSDPLARGSYSCALPGKADCRALLAGPVDDRLFFAGEACSIDGYSTAHGAYQSGVAAAEQTIVTLRRRRAS